MAVFPNLAPTSGTAVSGLAIAMTGAPCWGVVIWLVLTLAAASVQTLFPQHSPDQLTWWTVHRAHRLLRRTDRRDRHPTPPA